MSGSPVDSPTYSKQKSNSRKDAPQRSSSPNKCPYAHPPIPRPVEPEAHTLGLTGYVLHNKDESRTTTGESAQRAHSPAPASSTRTALLIALQAVARGQYLQASSRRCTWESIPPRRALLLAVLFDRVRSLGTPRVYMWWWFLAVSWWPSAAPCSLPSFHFSHHPAAADSRIRERTRGRGWQAVIMTRFPSQCKQTAMIQSSMDDADLCLCPALSTSGVQPQYR